MHELSSAWADDGGADDAASADVAEESARSGQQLDVMKERSAAPA
ncbi:MAG: hypothetical protein ACRD29_02140 [Acidimicrobiales bacterium]